MTGKTPDKLMVEPPPRELYYVYMIYEDMRAGEQAGAFGLSRLTWCTMESWCNMRRRELNDFELDLLRRLDNINLQVMVESPQYRALANRNKGGQPNKKK